jgi:predicted small integral membrane protein
MMWISTDAVNIFESLLSIVVCCHMKWELLCPGLGEGKKILIVHWSQGLRLDIDLFPCEKKKF